MSKFSMLNEEYSRISPLASRKISSNFKKKIYSQHPRSSYESDCYSHPSNSSSYGSSRSFRSRSSSRNHASARYESQSRKSRHRSPRRKVHPRSPRSPGLRYESHKFVSRSRSPQIFNSTDRSCSPRHRSPRYRSPRYRSPRHRSPRYSSQIYGSTRYRSPRYRSPRYRSSRYHSPKRNMDFHLTPSRSTDFRYRSQRFASHSRSPQKFNSRDRSQLRSRNNSSRYEPNSRSFFSTGQKFSSTQDHAQNSQRRNFSHRGRTSNNENYSKSPGRASSKRKHEAGSFFPRKRFSPMQSKPNLTQRKTVETGRRNWKLESSKVVTENDKKAQRESSPNWDEELNQNSESTSLNDANKASINKNSCDNMKKDKELSPDWDA